MQDQNHKNLSSNVQILAIVQARMSSSRLPGKVMKSILEKPMLELHIERIQRSKEINRLVIATSTSSEDDCIEQLCKKLNVEYYRGSLNDVLDRFAKAAAEYQPEYVLRLTGDCPLFDPELCDEFIKYALDQNYDYCTNAEPATYPNGVDMEIMTYAALQKAAAYAKLPSEREHVTPYIKKNPMFHKGCMKHTIDLSHQRWTVDNPEDFEVASHIFSELYPINPQFTWLDVVSYMETHPDIAAINSHIQRNEGFKKSLEADKEGDR